MHYKLKQFGEKFTSTLKDYCLNCTLAGLSYIADSRYHITERLFWLICMILAWTGCLSLVFVTLSNYKHNSVSISVGDFSFNKEILHFPSIGLCEYGSLIQLNPKLENIIKEMLSKMSVKAEYNYDIEDFLRRVIYQNMYDSGTISAYCVPYENCDDNCLKCPKDNYQKYAQYARANCSELIDHCYWKGVEFDCCKYFLPLNTSNGECFLLNSVQITERNAPNWFPLLLGKNYGNGKLRIETKLPSQLFVLNEEDIPQYLLQTLTYEQSVEGIETGVQLSLQNMVNDGGVRNIDPEIRQCIFPDEKFDMKYRRYSYSVCVTECVKKIQLATCNCTHYNLVYDDNDKSEPCDYEGMNCLDKNKLMSPKTTILQPWRSDSISCHCLPSCNENKITEISSRDNPTDKTHTRAYEIGLQFLPSQIFRRQAVRDPLDVVVSIGGIVGLFVGASILSLVEFLYFFSIRLFGIRND